jgi:16S rRNA (cytosine967-C5)-methyltransferase
MTPSARLQAAIEMLELVDATPRPADGVMGAYFRGHRYIGSKDRVAVAELVYGVMRHQARMIWWCDRYKITPTARVRMLAYLRMVGGTGLLEAPTPKSPTRKPEHAAKKRDVRGREHDAKKEKPDAAPVFVSREVPLKEPEISKLFSGGKYAPEMLAIAEEKFLGQLRGHDLTPPNMPLAIKCEIPDTMFPLLQKQFGNKFETEMTALLRPAPLDLRVNPVKATTEKALQELENGGLRVKPCRYSPYGIRLSARVALPTLSAFKEGRVEVQDEGSQLVALLVDAKPGMRVVDFCAGAGGKTLAIAAMMANKGRVTALDVLGKRLLRAEERFRRAGLHNIEARALSSESDPWIKRHKNTFDRVLVDAPCGGSGTWRRNPDARWKNLGPGLVELLPLQQRILTSAARLVKPGGRLIYATCSLLDVENSDQIAAFLAAHPDFTVLPYTEIWPTVSTTPLPGKGPFLRLTPAQHDTDGFFAAVMARKI